MSIFSEFREFIARGNVIDLAVGVIVGAGTQDGSNELPGKVVMPPIGLLLSGVDFSHLELVLKPDNPLTKANELVAIQYGAFLNTMIKFTIVAWVVFLIVKGVNTIRRHDAQASPAEKPAPPPQEALLIEIRDLLKNQAKP